MKRTLGVAAALLLLVDVGSVRAGQLDPDNSFLSVSLSGLPAVSIAGTGNPGSATLVDDGLGGHKINADATIWTTQGLGPDSSLFTGVPLITNLKITVKNGAGMAQDGFAFTLPTTNGGFDSFQFMCDPPCMGGLGPLQGQAVVGVLGVAMVPVDLSVVGGPLGGSNVVTLSSQPVTLHGAPFVTGWVQITNVTTNVVSVPALSQTGVLFTLGLGSTTTYKTLTTMGGFASTGTGALSQLHTVEIHGTNQLASASKPGRVVLISPLRIDTGALAGNLPGVVEQEFVFVPEPGALAVLIAGAVGLVALGRRRTRK